MLQVSRIQLSNYVLLSFYKGLKSEPMDNSFAEVTLTSLADLIPANSSPEDIEMLSASLGKVDISEYVKRNQTYIMCTVTLYH